LAAPLGSGKSMIKLSIVTLSYNTKDLILASLRSIISQYGNKLENKEFEIIIVDNNSSDNSVKTLKNYISIIKCRESIKLIESKENLGFGKGCNLGAKNAKGEYILFLNSDTEVMDKGFLNMVNFMQEKSVVVLGGKLENPDGSPQASAGKFYNLFNLFFMLLGFERLGFLRSSPNKISKVDWISGACMMVKREIFEKLSGFDEKLFMYVEDMEFCFRAQKSGYDTYFYPNIRIKHKSQGSSDRTFAIINIYKGILHFYLKHKSYPEYLIAKSLLVMKAKVLILAGFLTLNSELKDRYKKAIS
jgi:GT2 family glycosyltransferase